MLPATSVAQNINKAAAHDLDLTIKYLNREPTLEGVLGESSYEEKMLRRNGHVRSYRVLPGKMAANDTAHSNHEHKDFNYIVLPRHARFDGSKISVEFISDHDRQSDDFLLHAILP
jgi:hypothetical protein